MKKIIAMLLTLMLVLSMAVPVQACTEEKTQLPSCWQWWEWPGWWWNRTPDETTPTEPEQVELGVPEITEGRYYHSPVYGDPYFQIRWDAAENAERYEVEIVKADGTREVYTANTNILLLRDYDCPVVYVAETSTWTAPTVRVRAMAGDTYSEWSEAKKAGCDSLHIM